MSPAAERLPAGSTAAKIIESSKSKGGHFDAGLHRCCIHPLGEFFAIARGPATAPCMAFLPSTIAAIFVSKQPPSPSRYGTPCTIQIAIPTAEVAAPLGTAWDPNGGYYYARISFNF